MALAGGGGGGFVPTIDVTCHKLIAPVGTPEKLALYSSYAIVS